jgi:hypothetical protein
MIGVGGRERSPWRSGTARRPFPTVFRCRTATLSAKRREPAIGLANRGLGYVQRELYPRGHCWARA